MTLSRRSIAVIIVAALPAALSACGSNDAAPAAGTVAGFPFTVQSCGRTVTFDKLAERVITIGSDAHVAVAGAGGVDKIVARAGELGVPPPEQIAETIKDVPIIESQDPSLEAIVDTKADLAISYGLFETTAEDLDSSGVKSLVQSGYCGQHGGGTSDGHTDFDDVYADLKTYGHLFGTQAQADKTVADLRKRVADIRSERQGKPRSTAARVAFIGEKLYTSGTQSHEKPSRTSVSSGSRWLRPRRARSPSRVSRRSPMR